MGNSISKNERNEVSHLLCLEDIEKYFVENNFSKPWVAKLHTYKTSYSSYVTGHFVVAKIEDNVLKIFNVYHSWFPSELLKDEFYFDGYKLLLENVKRNQFDVQDISEAIKTLKNTKISCYTEGDFALKNYFKKNLIYL